MEAERAVLAGLEGGCQVPVGVWARQEGRKLVIEACVLAADGSESMRVRRVGLAARRRGFGAARLRQRCSAAAPNACFDRRGKAPRERPLTLPEHADSSPLAGRRIVITRAPEQSQELFDRLRDAGAEALSLPMVRFLDPEDTGALDRAIGALDEFDWLVLTSANAVQFFLARCRKLDRWPRGGKPKIAAVGPATRAALEAAGLRAAFMPQAFNGAALAAELAPHLPGQRVLLPRSDRAAADLPAALRGGWRNVTEVVAYRTAAPESLDRFAGGDDLPR